MWSGGRQRQRSSRGSFSIKLTGVIWDLGQLLESVQRLPTHPDDNKPGAM